MKLNAYYTYDEMISALESLAADNPRYMRLEALAETPEGRYVPIVTLADFDDPNGETLPAYYIQANIHACEACGTNVCIYLIEQILKNPAILSTHIYYLVPRVNPDGAERAMTRRDCTIRSRCLPLGCANALMPQDVDGDGLVSHMRIENPLGAWKALPGRGIMVAREPGDMEGPFYDVYNEGLVENYNGGSPVHGERNIDLNRSYPVNWKPLPHTTDYPGQAPEVRAILEFLTSHKNIYAGVDLHNGTSGILRPTERSNSELVREDRNLMREISALASKITGFQDFFDIPYGVPAGESRTLLPGGACDTWYEILGLSHYTVELGNGYNSIGMKSLEILNHYGDLYGELLEEVQDFHEARGETVHLPWKPFDHPQLGKVEIGGRIDGQAYHMYLPDMENFVPKVAEFLNVHSEMLARLIIGNVEVLRVAEDVWRVRAECMNVGKFGTQIMQGSPGHLGKIPVAARLTGAEILNADPNRQTAQLRSMEKFEMEWFVRAVAGTVLTLNVSHPKSVDASVSITLEA
ncbi:MAG: hypothetical protein E7463_13910 [Ruminococcaceae bacterium]|nr:hypothetical protein [Oscillospiraceae bacterium]